MSVLPISEVPGGRDGKRR